MMCLLSPSSQVRLVHLAFRDAMLAAHTSATSVVTQHPGNALFVDHTTEIVLEHCFDVKNSSLQCC